MNTRRENRRRFLHISGAGGIAALLYNSLGTFNAEAVSDEILALLGGFTWIKHAGFRIQDGDIVIYIDPFEVSSSVQDADLILITHEHGDHCDATSVASLLKDNTQIVTETQSAAKLQSLTNNITTIEPGDEIAFNGITIQGVRSYNLTTTYHPKSNNWLGFVITLQNGRSIYHAGDTDHIPEMAQVAADIALLPIGGTYTMNATEAVEAAKTIHPQVAIPMHYGSIVGSAADAQAFEQALAGSIEVMIFQEGQTIPPATINVSNWPKI